MADLLSLLSELIRHPTHNPGGDEPALAAWLADRLRERGADEVQLLLTERPQGPGASVYARWGTPSLLVNAHLDTVPPNDGWSGDPFVARREGDRIVGLGACDTKGAVAAILAALDEAPAQDVAVLFSGDEERGNLCMRDFLASPLSKGIRRAVVCEPTGLAFGVRHRGILSLEAECSGPGGHSSRADHTPAPVARLAHLAAALDDLGRSRRDSGSPGFQGLCMNVARLEGGVAFNVIPAWARLSASVRPPPDADQPALRHELEQLARTLVPEATVRFPIDNPPFRTGDALPFAALLGERPQVDLGFWTEAAMLSEAGIDSVVFGPGDIRLAHSPDEWVPVAELEGARDAFVQLFRRTARGS